MFGDLYTEATVATIVVLLFHAVLAPATALHALLYKRDPRAAFGWIAVCILAPLAGPLIYVLFGLNRVRSRASDLAPSAMSAHLERGAVITDPPALPDSIRSDYRRLATIGQSLSRHGLVAGNRVEPLVDGEQAYPAMLAAIDSARRSVLLSSYIFDTDGDCRPWVAALQAAKRRGVEVRVLVDGFGEYYSRPKPSRSLSRAGIPVTRFMPPRVLPPTLSLNMRNHHKILVVDNQRGFTGGMNIGNRHWVQASDNRHPTRDLHFELEGPIVGQLSDVFAHTWALAAGESLDLDQPEPTAAGDLWCRTLTDGPDEDLDRLTMLWSAALAQARHTARIMTPYFLPPRELVGALQAAALRGIEIDLILPAQSNLPVVHWATRNMLWELLIRGVRVWYQPPPFNHSKLFIIDRDYSQIGSANWDPRSLRLNFELQVEVYGRAFGDRMVAHFDAIKAASRAISLEEVDGRPFVERLRDATCWLFSPYL